MIPKIIHYCWFGDKELPQSAIDCIESWRKYLPDFEIKCWNESNFDINSHQFVKECYEVKKFGFIVDVLRNYVLVKEGGIYLDTDVEFIKTLDDEFLKLPAFISYELGNFPNVGLVASEKNGNFVNDMLSLYNDKHFINKDGSFNQHFTGPIGYKEILKSKGLKFDNKRDRIVDYIEIFPQNYFSPKDYSTDLITITKNTYAIHHYEASWIDDKKKLIELQRLARINYFIESIIKEQVDKDIIINLLKNKWRISNSYLFRFSIRDFLRNKFG